MENQVIEEKKSYNKFYILGIGIFLFLLLIFSMFIPGFIVEGEEESINVTLSQLIFNDHNVFGILSFVFLIISLVVFIPTALISDKNKKVCNILTIVDLVTFLIASLSYILITYVSPYVGYTYSGDFKVEEIFTIIYLVISVILFIIIVSNYTKKEKAFTTKEIAEISILLALSIVLDKIKISVGADGGSVNVSAFPLILIGLRFGFIKGFISSSIFFGLITNLLDGYGIMTYPFDYLIAFSFYSAPGLFYNLFKRFNFDKKNEKGLLYNDQIALIISLILGQILSFVVRMFGGSLSSIILYDATLAYALSYNLPYVGLSALSCLILGLALVPVIARLNKRYETKHLRKLNLLTQEN